MVSAADIITYIGVPLAILGVAPILYTYVKTMIMSLRLRRTLKTFDIEASVQSRLLSGIVDVNLPAYQLTLPPRDHEEYWSRRSTDGSRHGASWQNISWLRRPIDERMLQVHFSDRVKLPEASISFADLIYYLGDLGLQTNPEGFWELAQKGLNVLPGTCLVSEIGVDHVEKPILVVAKPTVEHPGTLLLRFQNKPSKSLRTHRDLGPDWIRVPPFPATTVPAESEDVDGIETVKPPETKQVIETAEVTDDKVDEKGSDKTEQEIVEYVRISRKGIIEKKLTTGIALPVIGLPFWFVYAMLANTAQNEYREYNGRPFGFQIRLGILYFSREFVISISQLQEKFWPRFKWNDLVMHLVSPTKMDAIPKEWTEDSPARRDVHLTKRFELLGEVKMRNHSAKFRRERQKAFQVFNPRNNAFNKLLPLEVFTITAAIWSEVCGECGSYISPLTSHRVPTSQEICVAAMSNTVLATRITDILTFFLKWFENGAENAQQTDSFPRPSAEATAAFMCAIIILQSIAEGAPYLAALMDVEECTTKWDPIYLC